MTGSIFMQGNGFEHIVIAKHFILFRKNMDMINKLQKRF